MKAIRVIAIALLLLLSACGGSGDEGAQIASADVDTSTMSDVEVEADRSAVSSETSEPAENDGGSGTDGGESDTEGTTESEYESNDESDTDAVGTALLARVSGATVDASTARFEGTMAITGAADSGPVETIQLTVTGAYDLDAEATDLEVDLSGIAALVMDEATAEETDLFAAMFAEPVRFRAIGDTAWFKWGILGSMFGATLPDGSAAWIEARLEDATSMTAEFGVDSPDSPADLLQALSDLDATVTDLGRESVRGVDTTHYRVLIDLEAAVANLPAEERAELEAELPGGLTGELPIDVWLDDADLLRRLVVEFTDFEAMGLGADAGELTSIVLEFEIFDVGQPVGIEAPAPDQVITADDLGFDLENGF